MPDIMIAASFDNVNGSGILPFNSVTCSEEFETFDTIMTSQYNEEEELTELHNYQFLYGAWYDVDESYRPCTDDDGLELGRSAWFGSESAKTITTSGQVHKDDGIHTFTEPDNLCASYYPMAFCPNSENVSWDVTDFDTIMTAQYNEEDEITELHNYQYLYGAWYDVDNSYTLLAEDDSVVGAGGGFWLNLQDAESTFSEVSPLK